MLFNQSFKTLFVVICVFVILAQAKPKPRPQEPEIPEIIIEEEDSSVYDDDQGPVIDADSFPLAPDVPGSGGVEDYHIRKLH